VGDKLVHLHHGAAVAHGEASVVEGAAVIVTAPSSESGRRVFLRDPAARSSLTWRFAIGLSLSLGFMLVELVVGFMIGSLALQADAFHMAGDVLSQLIGLLAARSSSGERTRHATFGNRRAEVLGALTNCVFLLSMCFVIFLEALQRFASLDEVLAHLAPEVDLLLTIGAVGLGINLIALAVFGLGHDHGESHGHSHGGALNMRGVVLHVLGDALGSVAVITAALAIKYSDSPYRALADPLCSLLVVGVLVLGTMPTLHRARQILAQKLPETFDADAVARALLRLEGVLALHDLHFWQLSETTLVGSLHAVVSADSRDYYATLDRIKGELHARGVHASTV
jgi:cation diffusion facilitator family transporter